MSFGVALAGIVLGLGQAGNSFILPRIGAAGICIALGLLGFFWIARNRKVHRIDISGTGQIRLTEYSLTVRADAADRTSRTNFAAVVGLMADSTLWPGLLLLRLQAEDGHVSVLPVLPDSVEPNDFRALSVAFRWIALRGSGRDGRIS